MTFEALWTVKTVKQIRQEYVASSQSCYLCNASPTFCQLWEDFEEEIRTLADGFIPSSQYLSVSNVLFVHPGLDNRKTRIDFLDYCLSILNENK